MNYVDNINHPKTPVTSHFANRVYKCFHGLKIKLSVLKIDN